MKALWDFLSLEIQRYYFIFLAGTLFNSPFPSYLINLVYKSHQILILKSALNAV
jgi:hypothetical protein